MDLFRFDPPDPSADTVRRVAREVYGVEGTLRRLLEHTPAGLVTGLVRLD